MRVGLLVLVLVVWSLGCGRVARGAVQGRFARAPQVAEISFVPEFELRPALARREALQARLEALRTERFEAELEVRRATDESLSCRLALMRRTPAQRELESQKRKLLARSLAALMRRRELNEWAEAARREATVPLPVPAVTVTSSRDGHFEAALAPGRYGVTVKRLGPDGQWHTSLTWTQVEADSVGEVELDE